MSHCKVTTVFLGSILLGLLSITTSMPALEVPALKGRVNDYAAMISAERAHDLEEKLRRFEQETGHQIAVLIVPSLEGEDLEGFSIKVAENWKIGHKGFDNGAILIIARDDRKIRIEVGYGLEGVLPDAIASRIIRDIMAPQFCQGDYTGGIEAGVEAIHKASKGESAPGGARTPRERKHFDFFITLVGIFIMTLMLALFTGMTQRRAVRGAIGGTIAGAATTLGGALALGPILWILNIFLGTIFGIVGSHFARAWWGRGAATTRARYHHDSWGGGVFRTGFGGGSAAGFGGGGFSGGGGGFGGGGASGGW